MNMAQKQDLSEYLTFSQPISQKVEQDEQESYKWNHSNTLMFLGLFKQYRNQVGSLKIKSVKRMFEEIALQMTTETKRKISPANCENRWKHLERMYKKYIDNNRETGRGRRDFEYNEVMDDILARKKNINPVILLSTDTVSELAEKENMTNNIINYEQPEAGPSTFRNNDYVESISKSTKSVNVKSIITNNTKKYRADVLAGIRKDRMDYYQKRLDIEEQKLAEKKRYATFYRKEIIYKKYLLRNNYILILTIY